MEVSAEEEMNMEGHVFIGSRRPFNLLQQSESQTDNFRTDTLDDQVNSVMTREGVSVGFG